MCINSTNLYRKGPSPRVDRTRDSSFNAAKLSSVRVGTIRIPGDRSTAKKLREEECDLDRRVVAARGAREHERVMRAQRSSILYPSRGNSDPREDRVLTHRFRL